MRKLKESRAMQDDLISCISVLGYSIVVISDHVELEPWQRAIMTAGVVLFIAATVLRVWRMWRNERMTPEEQQELKREQQDERSQMLQSKAMEYCWQLEHVLLVLVLFVFIIRGQPTVYCLLYAVLAVRISLNTAIRWWLEQKY